MRLRQEIMGNFMGRAAKQRKQNFQPYFGESAESRRRDTGD